MTDATQAPGSGQAGPAHTALHAEHAALGASFTDFGGWDMPLKYGSELAEHRAVREAAGLFDLSHMGEIRVTGPDAATFLNTALVGNFAVTAVGRAKYSLICDADGGIIDDLITYRLGDTEFLVVPNAGNAPTVAAAFAERAAGFDVTVRDESAETSLVAVQGPASVAILHELVPEAQRALVSDMKYYAAAPASVAGIEVLLARTGYTGEDGFELYVPNAHAAELWRAVLASGEAHGLIPAGLASRDSLRLEAGMPLYGNELSRDITPFEAGLGPVVSFKKAERFVGRDALEARREETPSRVLVGLQGAGRRAGRAGYAVLVDGVQIGEVTSGQPSPTLGFPIALASIDPAYAEVGTELTVDLRGKPEAFTVVALPFYRRAQ
ncbi:glycine cleavage system aminomethyltransferase GcvT [Leucobacter chromiireducens]|uniref:Aminomethyltransferase n=1 Tax=Leucobacter chromiireducens subsp. solipictus TaxID=398235 RepID=A0ABS1SF85_9MICO|nr:glycine cleavage system aminomethyltransferase GcvT [Leucobacter chromiireducens]MBL3679212.1 glycine cleavage system aminomethyltransferase GcvT [Leucobacter chromiireducens subsp. solipictus]